MRRSGRSRSLQVRRALSHTVPSRVAHRLGHPRPDLGNSSDSNYEVSISPYLVQLGWAQPSPIAATRMPPPASSAQLAVAFSMPVIATAEVGRSLIGDSALHQLKFAKGDCGRVARSSLRPLSGAFQSRRGQFGNRRLGSQVAQGIATCWGGGRGVSRVCGLAAHRTGELFDLVLAPRMMRRSSNNNKPKRTEQHHNHYNTYAKSKTNTSITIKPSVTTTILAISYLHDRAQSVRNNWAHVGKFERGHVLRNLSSGRRSGRRQRPHMGAADFRAGGKAGRMALSARLPKGGRPSVPLRRACPAELPASACFGAPTG